MAGLSPMTRIDKAEEHKQSAGQTSWELAGLIAAIEAEFDGHIAPDLPSHQNFRKSTLHVIHFWKIKISLILHMCEMSGFLSQKVEIS